jgi:type I restriction enzyme S subunit
VKADCVRFKPHPDVRQKYLTFLLNSAPTRNRVVVHGVGRPRLNLGEIKAIVLPIPPLSEQDQIVDSVEDQLSIIEHLSVDFALKLTNAKALRQSILRHAFTGQLVPQDPDDEPASELLKRIVVERVAQSTKNKAPRKRAAKR